MTDYIADTIFWGLVKGALRLENFQLKVHLTILNIVRMKRKEIVQTLLIGTTSLESSIYDVCLWKIQEPHMSTCTWVP